MKSLEQEITKELLILDLFANMPGNIPLTNKPKIRLYDLLMNRKQELEEYKPHIEYTSQEKFYRNKTHGVNMIETYSKDKLIRVFTVVNIQDLQRDQYRIYSVGTTSQIGMIEVEEVKGEVTRKLYSNEIKF